MTESSTRPDVDAQWRAACRDTGAQLLRQVATLVDLYWQNCGQRPDQVVVLAGTGLVAALITATDPRATSDPLHASLSAWTYDRRTGVMQSVFVRSRMIVCEDTQLDAWNYRLLVPTVDEMLGRPTVERGTIQPAAAA